MSDEVRWTDANVREAVAANTLWYHTMELRPGVVTPGWFDLRPVVDRLPWPEVEGKRCLDIGTYDGFLAFELERRGAAEVVAIDISDHALWDWPHHLRAQGPERLAEIAGEKGRGFEIAHRALGSKVEKVERSVYDLDPASVGTFDVVVCGSLLLHLRDPMRALEAIRGVCSGRFLSSDQIDAELTIAHRRRAVAAIKGLGTELHWQIPNLAGHRRMIRAAGFAVERAIRPFAIPFGPAHPPPPRNLRRAPARLAARLLLGGDGLAHSAVLARPT